MSLLYQLLIESQDSTFPPEKGALRVEGDKLVDDQGNIWFGRGLSMFLLYPRYLRGEDIVPQLTWARSVGANYIRVFGPIYPPWEPEWTFYSIPNPDLLSKLPQFFDLCAGVGLRCEFVPVCSNWTKEAAQALLQKSFDIAAGRWNVFIECTNEPGQDRTYQGDLHQLIDPINRHRVLSATGAAWLLPGMTGYDQAHWLDYGTVHTQRDQHFPHDGKECYEWRNGGEGWPGMPAWITGSHRAEWDDEPKRIDEIPQSIDDYMSHYATSGILANCSLLHTDSGKIGLVPPVNGYQDTIVKEVTKLWSFIPPYCSYGEYTRPPYNTFPLEWQESDSAVKHAYCMWHGSVGWLVNCLPPDGWKAICKPGFRILEVGPRPWILKVGR